MSTTERPLNAKAITTLRAAADKYDLDPNLKSLLDWVEEARENKEQVPAGTADLILHAVHSGRRKSEQTDTLRYRSPEAKAEQDQMLEQVLPDVHRAARRVAGTWPSLVTTEDVVQILSVHFLEARGALKNLVKLSSGDRLGRLIGIGHDKVSGIRDDYLIFTGQFTYSVDEVRKLLNKGAMTGNVEGFDSATADLQNAFGELAGRNLGQANALTLRYIEGEVPDRKSAAKDVLSRAIESLTVLMNRVSSSARYDYNNGGGRRKALTRAEAQEVTDLDYDGVEVEDD